MGKHSNRLNQLSLKIRNFFASDLDMIKPSNTKEVFFMSKVSRQKRKNQGRDLRGSAPIAGQNRTDTATNAQDPMADALEMRMKREGHDM